MVYLRETNPFDILFRNFFDSEMTFAPASEAKFNYPVDIYENKEGLQFEIACTGLEKDDVAIDIEGDLLKISYTKKSLEDETVNYIHKGIARRSFNLGYKVATKFDLVKAEAEMKNGLLTISVPFAEASKPKQLMIK